MEKILSNIGLIYDKMGRSEKKIADFILQSPSALIPLSITELAENSGSSEATVVRFCKRLGLNGYQDLKISVAVSGAPKRAAADITENSGVFEVFSKVCDDINLSLEKTKLIINKSALAKAAEYIMSADKIVIFGLGNSAAVAADFAHKLLRLGFNAVSYSDNHMQVIAASHLTNKSAAVGISHSGSSKDILEALALAQKKGAKTISITNYGKSPIIKYSDCILNTAAEETKYSILGLSSRIAQLAIISSIYNFIVCASDASLNSINETEASLNIKKL